MSPPLPRGGPDRRGLFGQDRPAHQHQGRRQGDQGSGFGDVHAAPVTIHRRPASNSDERTATTDLKSDERAIALLKSRLQGHFLVIIALIILNIGNI